jgi:hypothetical protein
MWLLSVTLDSMGRGSWKSRQSPLHRCGIALAIVIGPADQLLSKAYNQLAIQSGWT